MCFAWALFSFEKELPHKICEAQLARKRAKGVTRWHFTLKRHPPRPENREKQYTYTLPSSISLAKGIAADRRGRVIGMGETRETSEAWAGRGLPPGIDTITHADAQAPLGALTLLRPHREASQGFGHI